MIEVLLAIIELLIRKYIEINVPECSLSIRDIVLSRCNISMEEKYMRRAIELAKKGEGFTNPNPMVGCVVVKDGKIISEDYHHRYGEYHAERNALLKCSEDTEGAELYVTLEPCCHHGKTPPCTDIIIEKGIKKVYVGSSDPNPLVDGGGNRILKENGIEVIEHVLEEECDVINEIFFHYIKNKIPFVAMKYAMTLDGKIAAHTGDSKWITSEEARGHVHLLRKRYAGIMAGIGTVIADNPMLNCRICEGADPVRIICDTSLRIDFDSNIVNTAHEIPVIIACAAEASEEKEKRLKEKGVQIVRVDRTEEGKLDLRELMRYLGHEKKIDSVLLEGGGTLNASALTQGIVNKVYAYIAPKLIGGASSKSPIEGEGIDLMRDAVNIKNADIIRLGNDICISGNIEGGEC